MVKKIRFCFTGKDLEALLTFLEGEGFSIEKDEREHLTGMTFARDTDGDFIFGISRAYRNTYRN